MSRLTPATNIDDAMVEMCDGNPGAASVVAELFRKRGLDAIVLLCHLDDMGVYGPDIWIAYKDVCGQDIDKLIALIPNRSEFKGAVHKAKATR